MSLLSAEAKKEEEMEYDEEVFESNIKFSDRAPQYLEEVNKFKKICKQTHLDIKPSWAGMNIEDTSADQLNMKIQGERIMKIFHHCIDKLDRVGYLLEFMKDNFALVRKYLKPEDAKFVMDVAAAQNPSSIMDHGSDKKVGVKIKTIFGSVIEQDLDQMVNLLYQNECLGKYIRKMKVEKDHFVRDLIDALKRLMGILEDKLKITAAEETLREANLKTAFVDYKDVQFNIKRLQEKLEQQVVDMDIKIKLKNVLIDGYGVKIEEVENKFKSKLHDIAVKSDKLMLQQSDESEIRQVALSATAKVASSEYEKLLEQHLANEKILRAKKFKVEAQLASWLAKFDQDIGERQNELDEIMADYESDSVEISELQALIDEQNKTYDVYKAEKDAEDEQIFNEKLYNFVAGRSARRIQRYWRAYRARKIARKKAKKARAAAKAAAKAAKAAAK